MISFFGIKNIEEIDFGRLVRQLPNRPSGWNPFSTQGQYISAILQSYPTLLEHEINTPLRLAHFIGQGLVETNFLRARAENLNYSAEKLKEIFGHKFAGDDEIRAYANKPEKIANRVYANRMQNGSEASGDGWRYRGRGFFQITGKQNYIRYGEIAGVDLVGDPEMMERDLKRSVKVAAAYFQRTGLAEFADRNDIAAVSRGVNRGDPRSRAPAHGEALRIQWTTNAIALVRDPQALLASGAVSGAQSTLGVGSTGEEVKKVQRWLAALGYAVGAADGVYGPATRRAVLAFQDEHALPTTGAVDSATMSALQAELEGAPAPTPGESPADAVAPAPSPPVAPPASEPPPAPVVESPPAPVIETPSAAEVPLEPAPTEAQPEPAPEAASTPTTDLALEPTPEAPPAPDTQASVEATEESRAGSATPEAPAPDAPEERPPTA